MNPESEIKTYSCPESENFLRYGRQRFIPDDKGILHFTEEECLEFVGKACRASCKYPFLFPYQYDVMRYIGEQFGFNEFSRTTQKIDGVYKIDQIVTTQGLLTSENYVSAVWHVGLPDNVLPPELLGIKNRREIVSHTFKGEKYFLVRVNDKTRAFNLEIYNRLENFVQSLEFEMPATVENIGLDIETGALTIKTSWLWLAMMGLNGTSFDEEERVILSEKLANSHPFFEYKAPVTVDWEMFKEPKDDNFQELCRMLLEKDPSINQVTSIGKTRAADRGRDLEVYENPGGFTTSKAIKWLVQCKYSTNSISPETIKGWTDRVREHGYDGFWLMTNNDITPSLFDQLRGVEQNSGIRVKFWQRGDFHTKLNVYAELMGNFFQHVP